MAAATAAAAAARKRFRSNLAGLHATSALPIATTPTTTPQPQPKQIQNQLRRLKTTKKRREENVEKSNKFYRSDCNCKNGEMGAANMCHIQSTPALSSLISRIKKETDKTTSIQRPLSNFYSNQ